MPVKNSEAPEIEFGWRQWLMVVTIIVVASTASSLFIYFQTQTIREGIGGLLVDMKKMSVDLSEISNQLRVNTERISEGLSKVSDQLRVITERLDRAFPKGR
jgi:hypothetical protein